MARKTPPAPPKRAKKTPEPTSKPKAAGAARKRARPADPAPPSDGFRGRTIKRYGNRRLYDPQLSRCVTIDEIADAVRRGEDLRVVDADSGADLTRRILTQIILEEQNRDHLEVVPIELLRAIISLRSEGVAQWLQQYLATGAQWLQRIAAGAQSGVGSVQDAAARAFPWLKEGMAAPFSAPTWPTARPPEPSPAPPPADDLRSEVAEMQRRIAELNARLGRR